MTKTEIKEFTETLSQLESILLVLSDTALILGHDLINVEISRRLIRKKENDA